MAKVIESLEHWGPLQLIARGAKPGRLPSVSRLFEHPDRPGGLGDRHVLSVGDFQKLLTGEGHPAVQDQEGGDQ